MDLYFVLFLSVTLCHLTKTNEILNTGVSEKEQKQIVELQNSYRLLITNGLVAGQPCGVNLKPMKWDDTLAESAQRIADSTIYGHVSVTDDRWPVGQNIFILRATRYVPETSFWRQAMKGWWGENKKYTYGRCCKRGTAHYTQMIWWNSEYIGCGYAYYRTSDEYFPYRKLYVCNYGPMGNVVGAEPYKTNETCG